MEPTPQDIAAVSAALNGQPTHAPAVQQPATPTPQPTPSQQLAQPTETPTDPFAMFGQTPQQPTESTPSAPTQPTQPTEPVPNPQPQQPTEPTQPTPSTPQTPIQEPQPVQATPTDDGTQTYEQYLASVLEGVPDMPAQPDPSQVNPDDPEAIKNFFDNMFTAAEQRFEANYARKQAFQTTENKLWNDAMDKYPSLRSNTALRDTVHAIRRTEFSQGRAVTPIQAAEKLLGMMQGQYQQGVADNQVVTTIESVQPQGGNGTTVQTTMDTNKILESVQTGGETALAQALDQEIQAGRM